MFFNKHLTYTCLVDRQTSSSSIHSIQIQSTSSGDMALHPGKSILGGVYLKDALVPVAGMTKSN
jgi:hypothetical protein